MQKQDGIIMIVSLVVLLVVSTVIIGFLTYVNKSIELTNSNIEKIKALYILEAGVAHAVEEPGYLEYTLEENFAGGNYISHGFGHYEMLLRLTWATHNDTKILLYYYLHNLKGAGGGDTGYKVFSRRSSVETTK